MTDPAFIRMMEAGRYMAMQAAPYAAQAISACPLVVTDKLPMVTMACDEHWRVYAHPDIKWTPAEIGWVWIHEVVGHLIREHGKATRSEGLDPYLSNIAQDLEIESAEWGSPVMRPKGGIHPSNPEFKLPVNKAWRWYYQELLKNAKKINLKVNCGSGSTGKKEDHELGPGGNVPAVSKEEAAAISRAVASELANQEANGRGNTPSWLMVWANNVIAPPNRDWRSMLKRILSDLAVAGCTEQIGAPRQKNGLLIPRWRSTIPNVAIIADTSGSMGADDGKIVLGAIQDAISICGSAHVYWTSVGTKFEKYTRGQKLNPVGGGGTDLAPVIEDVCKKRYQIVLIVTDCDTPWPARPPKTAIVLPSRRGAMPPPGWRKLAPILTQSRTDE